MKRLVLLLAAIAASVALAGAFLPSDAATVGPMSVSRQSLDSELSAIAGSPEYSCFLSEEHRLSSGGALPLLGAGTSSANGGVYAATFVDDWLSAMITDRVTTNLLEARHLRLTHADVVVGRDVLVRRMNTVLAQYARATGAPVPGCGGSARAVLSSLPGWFVARQTRAEAAQALLDARAAGAGLSGAAVSSYFGRNRRSFARDCLDVIVVKSAGTARKVEAALAAGTSFASEAQAESLTRASAGVGGSIGCGILAGTFLDSAVAKLQVGSVTSPIRGDGALWVVRLSKRSFVPLSAVRGTVVTTMLEAGQRRADTEVAAALRSSTISVDPRYGGVSKNPLKLLTPAPPPPSGAEISASANRPSPSPAGA